MGKKTSYYIVIGENIGGGEVDAILRCSKQGGFIFCLKKPPESLVRVCEEYKVKIISLKEFLKTLILPKTNSLFIFNSFSRDLFYLPLFYFLRMFRKKIQVELAVHSDPKSGLFPADYKMYIMVFLYEIFGFLFANRIRFVSRRQLQSFKILSYRRDIYIDPPVSPIMLRDSKGRSPSKTIDVLFVGRLGGKGVLGDAKNTPFIMEFCRLASKLELSIGLVLGACSSAVRTELSNFQNVRLLEQQTDMSLVYQESKVLIAPSTNEGYGLAVEEAAYMGLMVLASKYVAPEALKDENVTVLENLVPSKWLDEICNRLGRNIDP
jgi:glycosyltransferase involved in cell wall biosynthesis